MPTQDTEPKITSLPLDILISLMRFLRPIDLIALRQTCRYLYEANHQRIVWIKALTDVCVENDVFLPTFPIYSMTTEQLLRAATAPSKISAFLRRNHDKNLNLTVRTTFAIKLPENDTVIKAVFLVPGGRFIVLLSWETLQLWDVDGEKAGLVASRCMLRCKNSTMSVQPTKDGTGLQLAVITFFQGSTHPYAIGRRYRRISIYQIFPLEGEPTFSEIAVSNEVDDGKFTPLISGDHLVMKAEQRNQWCRLLLWDFRNNLWATWDRGIPFGDVLIMSGIVLLFKRKDVRLLDLRNLEPRGSYQEPSPVVMEKMAVDSLLSREISRETRFRILGAWSDLPCYKTQDVIINLLPNIDRKSGQPVVQRYKMAAQTSKQAEEPSLVFQHVTPLDFEIRFGVMQYRLSEGDLVQYFLKLHGATKGQLVLSIMSHTEKDCFVSLKPHCRDGKADWDLPSLCPISGRICYLTGDEEREIVVADICDAY